MSERLLEGCLGSMYIHFDHIHLLMLFASCPLFFLPFPITSILNFQMSGHVSPTSSAARTTAVCQAAGSATMTTTVETIRMRRAVVSACQPVAKTTKCL